MYLKNSRRHTARLLPAAALIAALLLIFSSCRDVGSPVGTAERTETAARTETVRSSETATQTETAEETVPETAAPEKTSPSADRSGEEVYKAHGELTPVDYDSPALLPRTEDAGQGYIDGMTFLCDSPFYWLKPFGLLSDGPDTTQVWTGPEGTMTLGYLYGFEILDPFDNTLRTIPDAVALHRPPMILITVGINGVALWDEAEFKGAYVDLINEIKAASPDTVILTQSILPIAPSYVHWGMITNATITAANSWILSVSEECGLHYLDTFSALVGKDGNIRPELVKDDGLHANEDGLKLALEYIRTHAYIPETDAAEGPGS